MKKILLPLVSIDYFLFRNDIEEGPLKKVIINR